MFWPRGYRPNRWRASTPATPLHGGGAPSNTARCCASTPGAPPCYFPTSPTELGMPAQRLDGFGLRSLAMQWVGLDHVYCELMAD